MAGFRKQLRNPCGCTWAVPSVKCQTLGFHSGHDLMVHEIKPQVGLCADSKGPAWDSLSSLCPSPPLALSLSRNIDKHFLKERNPLHFTKEDIQKVNKHMKLFSTSLIIREIQIKTMKRYHLTPVTMAKINSRRKNEVWMQRKGMLLHC